MDKIKYNIIVVGLGYVGFRVALEMSKVFPTYGYDTNEERLKSLKGGIDSNRDIEIPNDHNIQFLSELPQLEEVTVFIVTVPTPIDTHNKPDLQHLSEASLQIGQVLKKGDIVVYESTTFPGCTRDVCIPILEKHSGFELNKDFGVCYCPERVSPGKNVRDWSRIVRVLGASNQECLEEIAALYRSTKVEAIYKVDSIEEAEMAKLVENCQRDVNISFVNEVALLCDRLGISSSKVLDAAKTKWNFHDYQPGLVGGHCIGVDPYYLMHAAEKVKFSPNVIGAGRNVNESVVAFIANKCIRLLKDKGNDLSKAKGLILGATYKENCSDTRNSKTSELRNALEVHNVTMDVYDPLIQKDRSIDLQHYDLIVLVVPHDELLSLDFNTRKKSSVLFDVKGVLRNVEVDGVL